MLTRKEFTVPERSSTWERSYDDLVKAIKDYLADLNRPSALEIFEATISADQGIAFPSTFVDASDLNTLDDYEEEEAFATTVTAGTGTFTTVSGTGRYTKVGNAYFWKVTITITTNGTAATDVRFTTPWTSDSVYAFSAFETAATSSVCGGYLNGTTGIITKYDGTYPGGTGYVITASGVARA